MLTLLRVSLFELITVEPRQSAKWRGPERYGVFRVFEVPVFFLFPELPSPLNGCFLEAGSLAEKGWLSSDRFAD
jgi:hypothetical protein